MTLFQSFMTNLDYGLRGPPVMMDPTANPLSADHYHVAKHMFGITYNILIILIMVAIITGIIIGKSCRGQQPVCLTGGDPRIDAWTCMGRWQIPSLSYGTRRIGWRAIPSMCVSYVV